MNLPKRRYYPLPEAANKMGCSVRDVIHYGANGLLDFYVFISNFTAPDDLLLHLNMPMEEVENIDLFGCLSGNDWFIYDVESKEKLDGFLIDGYYARSISGFFYISDMYIKPLEFSDSANLEAKIISTHSYESEIHPLDINFSGGGLSLSRDFLCIKEDDIRRVMSEEEGQKSISQTVSNNQSSLIKALLYIHYGADVAENPRAFFDNKDSEITKDFDIKGIELPSGKTISNWVKGAEIKFK